MHLVFLVWVSSAFVFYCSRACVYDNIFLSYCSPELAAALVDFAYDHGLAGTILFHVKDDTPVNDSTSLTRTIYERQFAQIRRPLPRMHLSKRSVHAPSSRRYFEQTRTRSGRGSGKGRTLRYRLNPPFENPSGRTFNPMRQRLQRAPPLAQTLTFYVPDASYPPSGARDPQTRAVVRNEELDAKLALVNVVAYIGLSVQTKQSKTYDTQGGTLYFQNPSSELLPPEMDPFCTNDNPICWFNGKPEDAKMGIFEAFAGLSHRPGNPLGPLRRIFSVVDTRSYEDTFVDALYIANFVRSARDLIVHYNLSGIDLDYENSSMTHAQSWQYLALLRALRENLPRGTYITLDLMCGSNYLSGVGGRGFAPGVLQRIGQVADVLNLMTYEMRNADSDYRPDGSGRTGFNTNLYPQPGAPVEYRSPSADEAVRLLVSMGVPRHKLAVGAPAFGRAVANVSATAGLGWGLFAPLTNDTQQPCTPHTPPEQCPSHPPRWSCGGGYSYKFITANMLSSGSGSDSGHPFVTKLWYTDGLSGTHVNGVTAFATHWDTDAQSDNIIH